MSTLARQHQWIPRLVGGIIGLLLLAGCGPSLHSYRYISLEGYPNARIIDRAQAVPGKYRFFVGEIPVRYDIKRERYTLTLFVSPGSWDTAISVQTSPNEYRIGFQSMTDRELGPCAKWTTHGQSATWIYGFYRCDDPAPWKHLDNHLRFTVFDQDGAVVAEEAIPYTVKWNGFYGYIDAV